MRTIYVDRRNGVQEAVRVIAEGGIAFFLGRMGMMLCSATRQETINKMILLRLAKEYGHRNLWGMFYPKFTPSMERDGDANSFKGLYKKLSHLLLLEDVALWAKDEYIPRFATAMPRDAPVMLRFPVNEENLPLRLRKNPTIKVIFTDSAQGMVADGGMLYGLLRAARERDLYIVGTSANFAGEPTIITTRELLGFANSLTGVNKVYLDFGVQKNRRGLDSLTILQPTGDNSALVLRKAKDYGMTRELLLYKNIQLTDAPNCVETTIAERAKHNEGY